MSQKSVRFTYLKNGNITKGINKMKIGIEYLRPLEILAQNQKQIYTDACDAGIAFQLKPSKKLAISIVPDIKKMFASSNYSYVTKDCNTIFELIEKLVKRMKEVDFKEKTTEWGDKAKGGCWGRLISFRWPFEYSDGNPGYCDGVEATITYNVDSSYGVKFFSIDIQNWTGRSSDCFID